LVSRQLSEFDLLREPERVIYFHSEVANGRLDLRVTEQQLDCSQVAGLPMELCDLGSSQRMGTEAAVIEPDVADPPMDDACVMSGRNVWAPMRPAPKQVTASIEWLASQQTFDRLSCHLRDFKLHRPTGLLLHNNPTIADESAGADVLRLETD
jgi:hypothetical protein